MADQPYYSVFTKKGLELLTESIRNGTKLGITSMAFGDGGGSLPVPNDSFNSLINEVYRTQLNSLSPDPNNANWLRAEAIIASATGGFNIRELGLYAGTTLVAYSNYPATYKPNPSDGTARIMTFRMVLQIDNTASFELKIDADIVLATITSVSDAKQELYENTLNTVDNIDELLKIDAWHGRTVQTRTYRLGLNKGSAKYIYNSAQASVNNGITIINGWVLQDKITVYRAGAYGDGVTDDTPYFQRAIDYSTYNKRNVDSNVMNNLLPGYTNIGVENGNYVLKSYLKTRGNMVVWDTADNTNFISTNNEETRYLCGLVKRGDKITRIDNLGGTYDVAAPLSIINNRGIERSAGLQGAADPNQIQKYDGGEQVGVFIDTHVKSPFNIKAEDITYTGIDTCTIKNVEPALYAKLTIGTPIITQHVTAYKAQVKEIEYIDDTTLNITVWGFYLSNPNVSDENATYERVQPPAGFGAYFAYIKSAFGGNITVWNENTTTDSAITGIELDMYNSAKDESANLEILDQPCSIGYYMANLGKFYIKFGFYGGFRNTRCMYMADSKYGQIDNGFVFRASASNYQQQNYFMALDVDNNQLYRVSYNGIELGNVSKSGVTTLDFHTSGNNLDYDARILATGGNTTTGNGTLTLLAGGGITLWGNINPGMSGYSSGTATNYWDNLFLKNSPTIVSDENYKDEIQDIPDNVLEVWSKINFQMYKLKSSIAEKGNDARFHFGVIAQRIKDIFEENSIDWQKYGILTYEKWDAEPEKTYETYDTDGSKKLYTISEKPAGEIYMVRYEECMVLEMAYQRKKIKDLEQKLLSS